MRFSIPFLLLLVVMLAPATGRGQHDFHVGPSYGYVKNHIGGKSNAGISWTDACVLSYTTATNKLSCEAVTACQYCTESNVSETITAVWTWDAANYDAQYGPGSAIYTNKTTGDKTTYELMGMSRYYDSTGKTTGFGFQNGAPAQDATFYLPNYKPAAKYLLTADVTGIIDYDTSAYLTAETDPKVGTLTNTKWCTSDGTRVFCEENAPVLSEVDPKVGTLTNGNFCKGTGTQTSCTDANAYLTSEADPVALRENDNALITGAWTFDPVDGGAPFNTTSTTMVWNLNAQMLAGHFDDDYVHAEGDFISGLGIGSKELHLKSYCLFGGGGVVSCTSSSVNFSSNSTVYGEINWESMLKDEDLSNGIIGRWRLTNDVTGNTSVGSSFMTLSFAEACAQAGCAGVERAEHDVLDIDVPQPTGIATLTFTGIIAPTIYNVTPPNNGAPAAGDCDADAERGRMVYDYANHKLYVCGGAARGWDHVDLID